MTIHAKLLTFRSKCKSISKDSTNPHFKSKYADLPWILEEIKQPLIDSGLSVVHSMNYTDVWNLVVSTSVVDVETDETITSVFPVFGTKPQEIGSSITYARRYNLQALLDLSTDDDDGNSANDAKPVYKEETKAWFNEKELKEMTEALEQGEVFSKSAIKQDYAISKTMGAKIQEVIAKYPSQFTN